MSFESRYGIRLYELIALRGGLDHKTSETRSLSMISACGSAVPDGKLLRWQDFKRKVLEMAVSEVNHVSAFNVSWAPIKNGRSARGRLPDVGAQGEAGCARGYPREAEPHKARPTALAARARSS